MVRSNENDTGGGGGGLNMMTEMGRNRTALRAIDANIVADRPCPSAMHKRSALIEKSVNTYNKNPQILARHRPITRKYSAQITSKQQQQPIKEDDDDKDDDVKMDCVDEYPIEDIDSPDKNSVFDVVEYVTDIHAFYKKIESLSCVPPDYMDWQPDINERMRSILIDWLIEVHYKFELMEETLYLTVNLVDRFLAVQPVARKKLQLVGVTAMLLACKYEEVFVPLVQDFISITDKAYSRNELLQMERVMINALEFNMSVPTPYVFVRRFLNAAQSDDKKLEWTSLFVIDLCLVDYQMLRFPPSQLAEAAVFTAKCALTGGGGGGSRSLDQWSRTFETHHSQEELLECAKLMVSLHRKAASGGRLTAVLRKYSAAKFGCVAKSAVPAVFLSDG